MGDQPDNQDQQTYHARLELPVDYVPQRVISLVPSMTESLFDLGLGQRLIAITEQCVRPADKVATLSRVGGTKNPDVHRITELKPDMVLMNGEENRREDIEALQDAEIPLWITTPHSIFEVLNLLWNLMDLFDHAAMVPRVREIERAYDYTLGASQVVTPVRVFVPTGRDPWTTFSAESYAYDVLRVCGGENILAQHPSPITLDDIVEAQPELILLPDEPYPFSQTDAEALRALDIPAAHTARIHLIDASLLTWHGTRVAYTLRDLPPLLMRDV